jgi:hypothetical protein
VSPMPKLPLASAEAPPTPALPLRIAETFRSIQGEGKLAGVPSFFIRVSGCNLRCVWCDTPYASWKPEGGVRGVEALAQEAAAAGTRHIVLTGGEPMLFPQIVPLSRALREHGLHVTIETAGTVAQPVACDLMSISPKLANSTPGTGPAPDPRDPGGAWRERHEQRRLNFVVLQSLIDAAGSGRDRGGARPAVRLDARRSPAHARGRHPAVVPAEELDCPSVPRSGFPVLSPAAHRPVREHAGHLVVVPIAAAATTGWGRARAWG